MEKCTGVYLVGHFYNYGGYADMAHQYALAFEVAGIPTQLIVTGESQEEVEKHWKPKVESTKNAMLGDNPYLIVVDIPPRFRLVEYSNVKKIIGSTIFETHSIPSDWVSHCLLMDEIWVPTDFNLRTFEYAGLPQSILRKVPLAIDIDFWTPKFRQNQNQGTINILCCGSLHRRKGLDKLIQAFFSEFCKDDNVRLIVSCFPIKSGGFRDIVIADSEDLEEYFMRIGSRFFRGDYSDRPELKAHYCYWSDEQFKELFYEADAYVSAERANGWALPVMQMMALGKPVCALDWGGSTEYLDSSNSILIEAGPLESVDRELSNSNAWYRGQYWPRLAIADLRTSLRSLVGRLQKNDLSFAESGKELVRTQFGYQNLAMNLVTMLGCQSGVVNRQTKGTCVLREHPFEGRLSRILLARVRAHSNSSDNETVAVFNDKLLQREVTNLAAKVQFDVNILSGDELDKYEQILVRRDLDVLVIDVDIDTFWAHSARAPDSATLFFDHAKQEFIGLKRSINLSKIQRSALFFSGGVSPQIRKLILGRGLERCDTFTLIPESKRPSSLHDFNVRELRAVDFSDYSQVFVCDEAENLQRTSYQNAEVFFPKAEINNLSEAGLIVNEAPLTDEQLFKLSIPKRWSGANKNYLKEFVLLPEISTEKQLALQVIRLAYFVPPSTGTRVRITVTENLIGTELDKLQAGYFDDYFPVYGALAKPNVSNISLCTREQTTDALSCRNTGAIIWSLKYLSYFERISLNIERDIILIDVNHHKMRSGFASAYVAYFALSREQIVEYRGKSACNFKKASERLTSLGKAKVTLFGTGPSLASCFSQDFADSINVVCNTMVKDEKLMSHLQPDLIVASDADFHFGPSRYAQAFRHDLVKTILKYKCWFICPEVHLPLFVAHHPEVEDYCIGIPVDGVITNFNLFEQFRVRAIDNVLLQFLLPIGASLSDEIKLVGFDGRGKDDKKFWGHNLNTQYSELMDTIEHSHPAFFFFRSYQDYYSRHCSLIEEYVENIEMLNKSVETLTESFVPALKNRRAI